MLRAFQVDSAPSRVTGRPDRPGWCRRSPGCAWQCRGRKFWRRRHARAPRFVDPEIQDKKPQLQYSLYQEC
eukprot:3288727-Rhodomonas_salina.2